MHLVSAIYCCVGNPMGGGAWWAVVHGVAQSQTRLSDFTFTFHFHALEKEMATHSSVLAWRIQGTGKPGGLPSTGSHRVGHDWIDLAAATAAAAAAASKHFPAFPIQSVFQDNQIALITEEKFFYTDCSQPINVKGFTELEKSPFC